MDKAPYSIRDRIKYNYCYYYKIQIFTLSNDSNPLIEWLTNQSTVKPSPITRCQWWLSEPDFIMFTLRFGNGYGYDD